MDDPPDLDRMCLSDSLDLRDRDAERFQIGRGELRFFVTARGQTEGHNGQE